MSVCRRLVVCVFVGVSAAVGCGDSPPPPDHGVMAGTDCATDGDCSEDVPKCSQAGTCVESWACEVDADCGGSTPVCHDYFRQCEPCGADADCPSAAPACVPNWETSGVYCAQCRTGDSSPCPAGTWCTSNQTVAIAGGGGACEPANCKTNPSGPACVACRRENYAGCDGDGGECADVLASLRSCYHAADPSWDERACPVLNVPSSYGCTPHACMDESDAVDACLSGCSIVSSRCET